MFAVVEGVFSSSRNPSRLDHRRSSSSPAPTRGEEVVAELQQDERQVVDLSEVIGWIRKCRHLDPIQ